MLDGRFGRRLCVYIPKREYDRRRSERHCSSMNALVRSFMDLERWISKVRKKKK